MPNVTWSVTLLTVNVVAADPVTADWKPTPKLARSELCDGVGSTPLMTMLPSLPATTSEVWKPAVA